jgi:hypothetical protein
MTKKEAEEISNELNNWFNYLDIGIVSKVKLHKLIDPGYKSYWVKIYYMNNLCAYFHDDKLVNIIKHIELLIHDIIKKLCLLIHDFINYKNYRHHIDRDSKINKIIDEYE